MRMIVPADDELAADARAATDPERSGRLVLRVVDLSEPVRRPYGRTYMLMSWELHADETMTLVWEQVPL